MGQNDLYKKLQKVSEESSIDRHSQEILNIVKLILYKDKHISLAELLQTFGAENFVKLLYVVGGKTITFPTPNEFKEIFTWATAYYAKEINGMDWKEIKDKLGCDQSSIKWSSKNKQLSKFIQKILTQKLDSQSFQEYIQFLSSKQQH